MRARLMLVAGGASVVVAILGVGLSPAGEPAPKCFGEIATEVGTPGHDNIDLSDETEPQVVAGLEGDDSIHSGTAGDLLCGDEGIDEIYGNKGKDKINTGAGRDYGSGEGSADLVKGGPGEDNGDTTWRIGEVDEGNFGARLDGGPGNDRIFGGGGNDGLLGFEGDDKLSGDGDTDECNGGPGHDKVDCEKPFPQM